MMTPAEELLTLRSKLAASERYGDGYKDRCAAIQKRIEELEKRDVAAD